MNDHEYCDAYNDGYGYGVDEGRQVQYELMRAENCRRFIGRNPFPKRCHHEGCEFDTTKTPCADRWPDCPLSEIDKKVDER